MARGEKISNFTKEKVMNKIGFDNKKYLSMQSEKIQERIDAFGDKKNVHQQNHLQEKYCPYLQDNF